MKSLAILLLAAGMTSFHPAADNRPADNKTYVSFKGSRQGQFKGASNSKGGRESEGWFEIKSFSFGVETPYDPTKTTAPTAKRQHNPITVRKEVDASSPLLLEALNTHESLEIVIQTLDPNNKVVKKIVLRNALVKGIHKDDGENVSFEYTDVVTQP